jgi:6-phosphogluconolactonase/glucosamine-6-phosphate isomerase/deaminase
MTMIFLRRLQAKNVVVIISGEKKRNMTRQLLFYTSFDPGFPLSIIYHPKVQERVEIFLKEDALE